MLRIKQRTTKRFNEKRGFDPLLEQDDFIVVTANARESP